MILNRDSIIPRIYRWFYVTNNMPENLCPYFWKLVLMWIVIVPYIIISIPGTIIFKKHKVDSTGERLARGILSSTLISVVLSMLWSLSIFFIGEFPKGSFLYVIQEAGIIIWFIFIVIVFYLLVDWLIRRYNKYKIGFIKSKKESSVIFEWMKATYNKYCPMISWK